MKVIRHGEEETAVKVAFALPAPDRIEDGIPYRRIRKLVEAPGLGADRDEKHLASGIEPQIRRQIVAEDFPHDFHHRQMMGNGNQ